jgi:hypothetical protein
MPQLNPSADYLRTVATAAANLVRQLHDANLVEGLPPAPLPKSSAGFFRSMALHYLAELERITNPRRLSFADGRRRSLDCGGWPNLPRVAQALGVVAEVRDDLLSLWGMEPICEAANGLTNGGSSPDDVTPQGAVALPSLNPRNLPPVARERWESLGAATEWLNDALSEPPAEVGGETAAGGGSVLFSDARLVKVWAGVFGCSRNTMSKRLRDGTYRTEQVTKKTWKIDVSQLPPAEQAKFQYVQK